jgi:choline dehydrogenase
VENRYDPSRRDFLAAAALAPAVIRQMREQEFDFVIVGAGAAGCVIANRLSANPQVRVLVLEAGPPDTHPLIPVLGKWTSLLGSPVDWNYGIEPDPGLGGRTIRWPRGKTYGGSSAIGAAAYVRGHQLCYNAWAAEAGAAWAFREVLPYFKRAENNSRGASDFRGAGGPLAVSDTTDPNAHHLAFLKAAGERGFTARADFDFNGPRQEGGAGFYQKNLRNGRRHSVAAAYLTPVLSRPNLTVWPNTQAMRVVFEGVRATHVEIIRGGARVRVRARREIVLAAGAIETPKLLMLSGIGPAAALRKHDISVVRDLPAVGTNLQDHPRVGLRWNTLKPLAPSTVSAGLFLHSQRSAAARPPDIQFYVGRGLDTPDAFITLTIVMSQPASRGTVLLRSQDPLAPPVIEANYLSESSDLDALVEGVRLARDIAHSSAYDGLRGAATDPADTVRSAADVRAFIRRVSDTIFHPVGTCRMGRGPEAVVDPELRVQGITGLRVADASIMPVSVNSQTMAATVMIGEKAAELMGA